MHCIRKISDSLTWVGGNDRRLAMFEGVYSVPDGVSYNSYVLKDEKIAVFDTVDKAVSDVYFENLEYALEGNSPDYLLVHHMEPDHAATLGEFVMRYPDAKIVCNAKTLTMIKQFFSFDADVRVLVVKEGDELSLGEHKLTFVNAPMVHWPEVMMSYEMTEGILFSADAFGCFGALNGAIFADEVDFDRDYLDEARRYYTNIVGKYGSQVEMTLKKAGGLKIKLLCPLHGFVWRKNIPYFIDKYVKWATYTPERAGVMIAYASIYGNTENAAEILSTMLREKGIETVMFDVSVSPASDIISAMFKYSHAVFASATYNAGIFVTMDSLLRDIEAHNIQKRKVAFIQNGSWAPASGKLMREIISGIRNTELIGETVDVRSSVKQGTLESLASLADEIAATLPLVKIVNEGEIEPEFSHKLSYGLAAIFTNDGNKDNACIVNTVSQVTADPLQISVCINKQNYTAETVSHTGRFNVSVLDESSCFELYKQYGFASGRDTDKIDGTYALSESANGLKYLAEQSNAFISAKVVRQIDLGTHVIFIAEVTEAKVLSDKPSATYDYYYKSIKPEKVASVKQTEEEKGSEGGEKKIVGWACKICGYVYEGEELPEDYICPLCKHPASDFEPIYN